MEFPCTALALETDRSWVYIGTKLANVRVDEEVVLFFIMSDSPRVDSRELSDGLPSPYPLGTLLKTYV
jgi:hypothetical protein